MIRTTLNLNWHVYADDTMQIMLWGLQNIAGTHLHIGTRYFHFPRDLVEKVGTDNNGSSFYSFLTKSCQVL